MNLKEKMAFLKGARQELVVSKKLQNVPTQLGAKTNISEIQGSLSALKQMQSYPTSFSMNALSNKVRLIIMLDISSSMYGTEVDIYNGIRELCRNHKNDNVLFTLVTFNDSTKVVYDEQLISLIEPQIIAPNGNTNLNGTLYETIKRYADCDNVQNLFVVISDGEDNMHKVSEKKVAGAIRKSSTSSNNFYFLGESDNYLSEESVIERAIMLGFSRGNIEVFTRAGAGNKLNFQVISSMLNDLLQKGMIRPNWNEPIKEHYLCLTASKRR